MTVPFDVSRIVWNIYSKFERQICVILGGGEGRASDRNFEIEGASVVQGSGEAWPSNKGPQGTFTVWLSYWSICSLWLHFEELLDSVETANASLRLHLSPLFDGI
jgi:hypothetical protein